MIELQIIKYVKNSQGQTAAYKREIKEIVTMVWKEQTPAQLKMIREKYYNLLVNCVEGRIIIKEMLEEVVKKRELSESGVMEVVH